MEKNGDCSKEEYFMVFSKICMILRPGIDADDLQRIIKEDFELDSMDKVKEVEAPPKKDENGDDIEQPKAEGNG